MPPERCAQHDGPPSYEAWVPPELADQLTTLIQRDVSGALGEGWQVDVYRKDYLAPGGVRPAASRSSS